MLIPSVPQLGIIAIIVALICGTKRLRDFGGDLGGMIRGVKDGFREASAAAEELGPELRELKRDAAKVKQLSTELVAKPAVIQPNRDWDYERDE